MRQQPGPGGEAPLLGPGPTVGVADPLLSLQVVLLPGWRCPCVSVLDEVGACTMSSCVSSQPSSDRAAPQDELGGRCGSSSEGQKPCEALRGLSSLSIRLGMESFIVVTECDPGCAGDHSLAGDPPTEADGAEVALDPRSQARPRLSGRKLSLQERSPLDANGRVHPVQPSSPVGSPQSSPRLPRRPTVESHHVSIIGMQVREPGGWAQAPPCKAGAPGIPVQPGDLGHVYTI